MQIRRFWREIFRSAAGSLALTGVALLVGRKHEWMRHVQRAAGKNMHAA